MQKIDEVIKHFDEIKKIRPQGYIITYNDQAIVLHSGKSIWKAENHAKSAFTNHIDTVFFDYKNNKGKDMGFKDAQELSHYLQNMGIIKIKRI